MQSIQMNKRFDREAGATDAAVTPELRAEYLAEADRLYAKIVSEGSQSAGPRSLLTVAALFGRASVAETKNDPTQAALFLTQAQELAAKTYPQLAKVAQHRKETLPQLANVRAMPSRPVDPAAAASTSASTENLLMPTNMNAPAAPQAPVTPAEGSAPVAPK